MYVTVLPTLSPSSLIGNRSTNQLEFDETTQLFRYGRDAILAALLTLGISAQDNVLLPGYTCEAVLEPFRSLEVGVKYYGVNKQLQYDFQQIASLIDRQTTAIYIIHYFGIPCRLDDVLELCHKHNLYLIEDCAHTFPRDTPNGGVGVTGDAAIYSLRKLLPAADGGLLKINNPNCTRAQICRASPSPLVTTAITTATLLLKHLCAQKGCPINLLSKITASWHDLSISRSSRQPRRSTQLHEMSLISRWIIERSDWGTVMKQRRANFDWWQKIVEQIDGLAPLFASLPEGACPYSFPVSVENRDAVKRILDGKGVFLERTFCRSPVMWDGVLNPEESLMDVTWLSRHVLSLPVHQNLDHVMLSRVARHVREAVHLSADSRFDTG